MNYIYHKRKSNMEIPFFFFLRDLTLEHCFKEQKCGGSKQDKKWGVARHFLRLILTTYI